MTSHELARQLLANQDMPVYLETAAEVDLAVKVATDCFDLEEGMVMVIVGQEPEVLRGMG